MRQPALLARCRLMDSRPDQRVPEPEPALVEHSEAGREGHRPVVDVDRRSEERFGRATQLGELAVMSAASSSSARTSGLRVVSLVANVASSRAVSGSGSACSGQVEIDRCGRELDQGKRIASRLREDPPL